ncbi:helix-turn-helix domain-containing protein [Nocardioides panacis]|uniref:Helix-turn-helix domain-containing protein n=1 Tax=Nocardioides panacis TaxID=2849501 RepID=A0A975SXC8_9ACTN|nr:helix-turn-helix domain-containing protein [Nocardioides panacis]QWZ07679.1 helix-turn-helix domain-containing protein [Nocardioides panacis]
MPLTRRRVTDTDALKALAHPVRLALLETLVTQGPMTATQAADRVGSSPSNCSWHLRKLAEHGFVREARGHTGRNRPWQAVSQGLDWGEPDADPSAGAPDRIATEALTDLLVEREVQRLRAAQASRDTEPPAWQEVTGLASSMLWLTAEEAADLRRDLADLLQARSELSAERAAHPGTRPEGARLVSLVGWLVPAGPPRDPEPGARP